jgi:plastocyanin
VNRTAATVLRWIAAVAVVVGGLIHLQLYFDGYRDVPNANLGRSFVANGIASIVIGAALFVRRDVWLRLAAIGLSASTLVAFALSRSDRGVFGFTEQGLTPSPQAVLTLMVEVLALGLIGASFLPAVGAGDDLLPAAVDGPPLRRAAPVLLGATLAAAVVSSALWAQGDDTAVARPDVSSAPSDPTAVSIAGFAFSPTGLDLVVGATLTWTNDDSFAHSVVARDDSFASTSLATGDSFSHTFDAAGTYAYICGIHPSMAATVVVTG